MTLSINPDQKPYQDDPVPGHRKASGWKTYHGYLNEAKQLARCLVENRRLRGQEYAVEAVVKFTPDLTLQEHDTVVVPMAYQTEPIIPDDLFQKVQEKLARNASRNAKPQTAGEREGYPLTGCLICGQCGYSLFAMPNKGNPRYQCRSATRHTSYGCGHWSIRQDEILPYLLHAIDREVLRKLNDTPTIPDDPEQDAIRRAVEEINAKIEAINGKMKTVSVDAIVALSDAIGTLTDQRANLLTRRQETDHLERVRAAVEHWEAMVEPYLIPIRTGDHGAGNPVVAKLGIQEDVDRYFNLTLARPSALRELFHRLATRVECWFRETGGNGIRKSYQLDKARLKAEIEAKPVTSIGSPGR